MADSVFLKGKRSKLYCIDNYEFQTLTTFLTIFQRFFYTKTIASSMGEITYG